MDRGVFRGDVCARSIPRGVGNVGEGRLKMHGEGDSGDIRSGLPKPCLVL